MKRVLRVFVALLVFAATFSFVQDSSAATKACFGSGEHCMSVDLGGGQTANFVKTKGSAAVVME
jgi:hypothetical protein